MMLAKMIQGEKTRIADFFEREGVQLHVRRGSFLFHQLDQADSLFFVASGRFVVSRETAEGKQFYLSVVNQGQLIGDFSLFDNDSEQSFSAKALENSSVYVVEKSKIEKVFFLEEELSMELMRANNLYNKINEMKFRDLVLCGKKGAIYSTLIRLANTYGVQTKSGILVEFKCTLGDIANFCGTTREGVTRMFSELKREQIIDVVDGKILIFDLEYLRMEIDCEECPIKYCQL